LYVHGVLNFLNNFTLITYIDTMTKMTFVFGPLIAENDIEAAAQLMANSDPWITLGRTHEKCLTTIRNPLAETYVVKSSGKVIGLAIIQLKGALVGYIQTIVIEPRFRGHNIGSQLIAFLEQRIHEVSPNIFMCVSDFNTDAQRLYKKLGFEVIGEIKNYIMVGHSEILLRKTICAMNDFKAKT
jgi:[ribosomal protein S18]-alanine N-acetyltransferase